MFYDDIRKNKFKSNVIIILFGFFVGLILYFVMKGLDAGPFAVVIAAVMASITTFTTYWNSHKIVLASVKAREIEQGEEYLQNILDGLLIAAGESRRPKLYVMESEQLNAFATGRNPEHAVICVTTGIMKRLSRPEMESVIGHELTHVLNYDIRVSAVSSAMAGLLVILADLILNNLFILSASRDRNNSSSPVAFIVMIVLLIVSPIIAKLIELAISRKREILADAGSVALTRNPQAMMSALESISTDESELGVKTSATASAFLSEPNFHKRKFLGKSSWWSSHPTLEERLEAIRKLQ